MGASRAAAVNEQLSEAQANANALRGTNRRNYVPLMTVESPNGTVKMLEHVKIYSEFRPVFFYKVGRYVTPKETLRVCISKDEMMGYSSKM